MAAVPTKLKRFFVFIILQSLMVPVAVDITFAHVQVGAYLKSPISMHLKEVCHSGHWLCITLYYTSYPYFYVIFRLVDYNSHVKGERTSIYT